MVHLIVRLLLLYAINVSIYIYLYLITYESILIVEQLHFIKQYSPVGLSIFRNYNVQEPNATNNNNIKRRKQNKQGKL